MDPSPQQQEQAAMPNPVTIVLQLLASYGWLALGALSAALYAAHRLRPHYAKWKQAREDAEYHKDPDKALARAEAVQRARDEQQRRLLAESQRALEHQKEREERKRHEAAERIKQLESARGGNRLGSEDDYLPLSGGASTSSYRAPKRSACSGGGCGR